MLTTPSPNSKSMETGRTRNPRIPPPRMETRAWTTKILNTYVQYENVKRQWTGFWAKLDETRQFSWGRVWRFMKLHAQWFRYLLHTYTIAT